MGYKTVKRKTKKRSFIERAQYLPRTYKYLESFFESMDKAYN